MNCVNINSKDFKDLLAQTGLPSYELDYAISKWQDINGYENFPTADDISQKTKISPAEASIRFLKALNFDVQFAGEQFLKAQAADKINTTETLASAADVMQKFVAIASNKEKIELPKQAAYILFEMLGRKNKLTKDIWFNIDKWSGYNAAYNKYANQNQDDNIQDYIDILPEDNVRLQNDLQNNINPFAKKMAIVEFIHQTLITYNDLGVTPNTKRLSEDITKEYFKKRGFRNIYEENILIKLMNEFLNWINEKIFNNEKFEKYDIEKLNDLVLDIVDDIYKEDYIKFLRGFKKEGEKIITPKGEELVLKDYEESVNADPKAKAIMDNILNNIYYNKNKLIGPKLSGSAATRRYGTTYRSIDEAFHDFDIVIPNDMLLTEFNYFTILNMINNNLDNLTPDFVKKNILPLVQQQSWYKNFKELYPDFKILNSFVGRDHKKGESVTITGVINGEFKNGKHIEGTGMTVDFFVRVKENEVKEEFDNYWKTWKGIYEAKLKMGRLKDIVDFVFFDPFIEDKYKFTNKGYRYFSFVEDEMPKVISDTVTKEEQDTQAFNRDLKNLNLTPEVVSYLYSESSKRLPITEYTAELTKLITILQGNYTNNEVLEKIKCL
jgi:preprotein translocase subunit SecE